MASDSKASHRIAKIASRDTQIHSTTLHTHIVYPQAGTPMSSATVNSMRFIGLEVVRIAPEIVWIRDVAARCCGLAYSV